METHIEHRTADCLQEYFRGEKFKPQKKKAQGYNTENLSWKGRTKKKIEIIFFLMPE